MISQSLLYEKYITGLPKGQPRPRAFSRGGKAAVYDPGTAEGWKSSVAIAVEDLAGRSLIQPLMVALTFFFPRPKSHFNSKGAVKPSSPIIIHSKKPDADNAAKAVLDALTILKAWQDDDQISDLVVRKRWAHPRPPGCRIQIYELTESS